MYITRPGRHDADHRRRRRRQRHCPSAKHRSDNFRACAGYRRGTFRARRLQVCRAATRRPRPSGCSGAKAVQAYKTLRAHVPHRLRKSFRWAVISRCATVGRKRTIILLVDCGEVGALTGGHGHADTLAIELAIRGKTVLVDSGTYTYHESRELRNYFRSTTAHNTLVIDDKSRHSEPGDKFSWKTKAEAKIELADLPGQVRFF